MEDLVFQSKSKSVDGPVYSISSLMLHPPFHNTVSFLKKVRQQDSKTSSKQYQLYLQSTLRISNPLCNSPKGKSAEIGGIEERLINWVLLLKE